MFLFMLRYSNADVDVIFDIVWPPPYTSGSIILLSGTENFLQILLVFIFGLRMNKDVVQIAGSK